MIISKQFYFLLHSYKTKLCHLKYRYKLNTIYFYYIVLLPTYCNYYCTSLRRITTTYYYIIINNINKPTKFRMYIELTDSNYCKKDLFVTRNNAQDISYFSTIYYCLLFFNLFPQ